MSDNKDAIAPSGRMTCSAAGDEERATPRQMTQEEFDEWVEENFTDEEIFWFIPEYRGYR